MKQQLFEERFSAKTAKKLLGNALQEQYAEAIKEIATKLSLTEKQVTKTVVTCLLAGPMSLVSIASICAKTLQPKEKDELVAITNSAELLVGMCGYDYGLLILQKRGPVVYLKPLITIPQAFEEALADSCYMPPMIEKPSVLLNNNESPYHTVKRDSLVLGHRLNRHDYNISLDIINTMNANCYEIDRAFIEAIPNEVMPENWYELDPEQVKPSENWDDYTKQCYKVYKALYHAGNKFYFSHKVDKRGRIYTQGYHVNPQGHSYKKAMLNLAHKEIIQGYL